MSDPYTPQRRAQIEAMRQTFDSEGWGTGEPGDAEDMARSDAIMNAALTAALSASAAPGGVAVRIAVAFDPDGNHDAYRIRTEESFAWGVLRRRGYETRAAIITATVQPPVVVEIAGSVEGGV